MAPDEMKIEKTFNKAMDQIDRLQKVFRDDGLLAKAVVDIGGNQDFGTIQEAFDNLYGALEDAHYDAMAHLGMDESIKESKADPKIVAKFAKVSPSQRSYYVMQWAKENGIDSDEAMEMAGYTKGSYMGAGSYNWNYVGESQVKEVGLVETYVGAPDRNPAKDAMGGANESNMPREVKLAGDSIWDRDPDNPNPDMVTVTDYEVVDEGDGYMSVVVMHDGPWTIYTDSGFEKAMSDMIGMEVSFSEQGMQEDGRAHLEGYERGEMESADLSRVKKLAGV